MADTYNHKIKRVGPGLRTSVTFLGSGQPGFRDADTGQEAEFYEPSGLSIADGRLYIADTNNHAIRVADLETGRVSTLQITGLSEGPDRRPDYVWPNLEELRAAPQTVRSGRTSLTVDVEIPPPFKLNPGSPLEYQVELNGATLAGGLRTPEQDGQFPIEIPLDLSEGATELRVAVGLVYCKEGRDGVCLVKSLRWTLPVETASDGQESLRIEHRLVPEWIDETGSVPGISTGIN